VHARSDARRRRPTEGDAADVRVLRLTKMHGTGNDYLFINTFDEDLTDVDLKQLARVLSDRHFGIGSDGMILVEPSKVANFKMRIFNSDGSEAEMCGNGIRCFAKYVYERGMTTQKKLEVETLAGIIRPKLFLEGRKVKRVQVDMGKPRLGRAEIPMSGKPETEPVIGERIRVAGERYEITCVSMGNPHCVLFVDNVDKFPVSKVGPQIENHNLFPKRTNVEFVQISSNSDIKMRVWERGAGETLACGTGASAAVVAGNLNGKLARTVTVRLLGGDLTVEWLGNEHVMLTGPAEEVFTAEVDIDALSGRR